jgi:hypothetical protein
MIKISQLAIIYQWSNRVRVVADRAQPEVEQRQVASVLRNRASHNFGSFQLEVLHSGQDGSWNSEAVTRVSAQVETLEVGEVLDRGRDGLVAHLGTRCDVKTLERGHIVDVEERAVGELGGAPAVEVEQLLAVGEDHWIEKEKRFQYGITDIVKMRKSRKISIAGYFLNLHVASLCAKVDK